MQQRDGAGALCPGKQGWAGSHPAHGGLAPSCGHPLSSQAEELRTQLRLLEEARGGLRRELLEAQRKVREGQDGREAQRQEASELRRSLSEGAREREALRRSNEELRMALKAAESERVRWAAAAHPAPHRPPPLMVLNLIPGTNSTPRVLGESYRWGVPVLGPSSDLIHLR